MAGAPTLLIIAGSDSGGGAGIQADLKTASARGAYGTTAITAVTAQNTRGVHGVELLPPELVALQIRAVLDDIGADAVKIGMLGSVAIVRAVANALRDYCGPVVLDPVMIAKSGDALLDDDAIAALRDDLLPRAALLTPNLPEAARLTGQDMATHQDDMRAQGAALIAQGAGAVLVKGGHARGDTCTDWLVTGQSSRSYTAPRVHTANTHGTGCSLSSAIAVELATGASLRDATQRAHHWLHGAILAADRLNIGGGHGPVHHFHEVWA